MTRENAYRKIFKSQAGKKITAHDIPARVFCDYAEALGLIQFSDENPHLDTLTTQSILQENKV